MINVPTTDEGKDNVISFKPPIIITHDEIDEAMDLFEEAISSAIRKR